MKQTGICVLILLLACVISVAQEQPTVDREKEQRNAAKEEFNNRVDQLRNTGKQRYIRDRYKKTRIYQDMIVPLYRELSDDEVMLLAPLPEDAKVFESFLNKKDRGLTKLIADKGCDLVQEVVVSNPHCEKYGMPGAGASYSFRKRMYRAKRLSDLRFTGSEFNTNGPWKHGILIKLGNIPLDELSVRSEELATLVGFNARMNTVQAGNFASHLATGINGGGLVYKDTHPVEQNTTYAIRSIAYPGKNWALVEDVEYDEFEFDRRRDVIVAFRVIRYEPAESVTIAWRILADSKAFKLKSK